MEVTGEQLTAAEAQLKQYLPRSQQVYGCLVIRNRVTSEPVKVLVDKWPNFSVMVCKPQYEEEGDLIKDTHFFAIDDSLLEETLRNSSVLDWTKYLCLAINCHHVDVFKAVASEKAVPYRELALCHMMVLEDVNSLPCTDSSGISLGSLDDSHVGLVNQTWKFGKGEHSVRMIRNMITNFPSCCVLDAQGQPVSWILTYSTCAMGMLYTLPEHRRKGYAKVLVSTMAKRLHAQGYPVYCFIEEENAVSYKLFKNLSFTEDPSYRVTWFGFNDFRVEG